MPDNLDSKVRVYASRVGNLPSCDEFEDAYAVLSWRDSIFNSLASGAVPTSDISVLLEQADQKLVSHRELLVQRFPDLFHPQRKALIPRVHWWWYLDEGSHVREEAVRAA